MDKEKMNQRDSNRNKYLNLKELLERIGKERNIGFEFKKSFLIYQNIYGSKKLIEKVIENIPNAENSFKREQGHLALLHVCDVFYRHTRDVNYLKQIIKYKSYTDKDISKNAKATAANIYLDKIN